MRTTIILSETLINKAMEETGISEKTKLIHMGLELLIQQKAMEKLSNLYGSAPKTKHITRGRKTN
ncbi:MAG TPA: type II toxin-antitoxin system VapB family antitoxin [Leptospiraceae bacterium]|nr:type II toxin-antitoxin system VapB family antitoxin [Leptospiraceae bacterium]HMW06472.1 type II toxin-antitoxin system VapB family antitoxin [Leptospiraceae bacterium]HMX32426.1 type II toxin-antitoxin system VapB family antitoxin [Leptospiraceae bacterium]HMY33669.1 type II toxin-antitoxin system VapB family antitoxin [Leptospiraceae bacterium]HMZ65220.1 type II toxin-antitoxin system VapB family antitoxin [Leptospiraceae bacterium]